MSESEFRASEFPVTSEVFMSMDTTPTPEAVAIVPAIPASERKAAPPIVLEETDERVEGLLKELLIQLKERKALEEVAADRWHRCSELLEEVRTARRLLRELADECQLEAAKASGSQRQIETLTEALEWLAKPI